MRNILLILLISTFIHAQTYTFLIKKYDKEIELESKIISKIAKSLISKEITLYIPQISSIEKEIYSKSFKIGITCEESDFIFVKRNIKEEDICENKEKIFFTNNYKKLLVSKMYIGAFFWSKNRPNIVFIKNRLENKKIKLPLSYNQFIEDIQ